MSATIPSKRPLPQDIQQQIAEARKRAAEAKARIEAQHAARASATSSGPVTNGSTAHGAGLPTSTAQSIRDKVEAMKARVAKATAKTPASTASEPTISDLPRQPPPMDEFPQIGMGARGGLAVGIHPALLDNADRGKVAQKPKAKGKGKADDAPKQNPYISEGSGTGPAGGRARRTLNFTHNLHARPAMQQANEMRRKANLEALKKKIQAQAAKAGLEETADIQSFAVPEPPDVEFWDEELQEKGIDDGELISNLVLHPILIEPPQEKFHDSTPQPLKLTKKEQKKIRRIRRAEEHKEEQAKIRLGLVPLPEPKINHRNVMRVYGEMAVKDPTAVEAMVNKQVAERKQKHFAANAERQLTKEERAEKIAQKAEKNAALGLHLSVYKIALGKDKLMGKHRSRIDMEAKWHKDITGCVLAAPSLTIALIEAGEHTTKKYKHYLLDRMKWKEILEEGSEYNGAGNSAGNNDQPICTLLWQGKVRDRKFKKWGSIRDMETDTQAKEALTRPKMDNFWTLAKSSS